MQKFPQLNKSSGHSIGYYTKNTLGMGAKILFGSFVAIGLTLTLFAVIREFNKTEVLASSVKPKDVSTVVPKNTDSPNPVLLTIPSLNISAGFEPLGLNPDRTLEVPKNDMGVGWFIHGAKPGQIGTSIIVGHLDSVKGPAVFANLNKIKPGDKIIIKRDDGSVVTYRVDYLSKFSQDNFPTQAVYSPVSFAGIRLITCSGVWNKKTGHYSDNLVVFGSKI